MVTATLAEVFSFLSLHLLRPSPSSLLDVSGVLFMKRNAITWWCGLITLAMSGAFLCLPLPFGIVLLIMWGCGSFMTR